MSWHLSKSNPCKIYNERHEVAALATSPEYAARIVAAVTGKSQEVIRLREPAFGSVDTANPQTLSDGTVFYPPKLDGREWKVDGGPTASTYRNEETQSAIRLTNSFEPDDCCGKHISKASRSGVLNSLMVWTCPRCETDWKPTTIGNIRHWKPEVLIAVLRR